MSLGLLSLIAVPVGIFMAVWFALVARAHTVGLVARLSIIEDPYDREATLARPFSDRVMRPIGDRLHGILGRHTPQNRIVELEKLLRSAGGMWNLEATGFLTLQLVLGFIGLALGYLVTLAFADGNLTAILIGIIACLGLMGYMLPTILLNGRVRARINEMRKAMPNLIDLLTIGVEGGLSFDAALARVTETFDDPLAQEFDKALNEVRMGRPRPEALRGLADRIDLPELRMFTNSILQSDKMGTGLAGTLRIQSEEMRRRRRQRAEASAARAPIKMLFPMVGCIFPTLFIVLLGPAAIDLVGGSH